MINIDGSFGEGGGQILRSSLSLSLLTGKAFNIKNIRAARKKPGLGNQHLTAVNAAAAVGKAQIRGNSIGSSEVFFSPGDVRAGDYHFNIGTAGSCMLILQTILPPLLKADGVSRITLEGGTHNPMAPVYDFLQKVFLPAIEKIGARVETSIERCGFYPAGGGKISVEIHPLENLQELIIIERGKIENITASAFVSRLPMHIAEREKKIIEKGLAHYQINASASEITNSRGPGNYVAVEIVSENITEMITSVGVRGVPAETIAQTAVSEAAEYLNSEVPVGIHLADQLLIPMAIARGGKFATLRPTMHTETNIEVIKKFLDLEISIEPSEPESKKYMVTVNP